MRTSLRSPCFQFRLERDFDAESDALTVESVRTDRGCSFRMFVDSTSFFLSPLIDSGHLRSPGPGRRSQEVSECNGKASSPGCGQWGRGMQYKGVDAASRAARGCSHRSRWRVEPGTMTWKPFSPRGRCASRPDAPKRLRSIDRRASPRVPRSPRRAPPRVLRPIGLEPASRFPGSTRSAGYRPSDR